MALWPVGSGERPHGNVQELTVEAIPIGRLGLVKQAAMLDPHTAAELSMRDIAALLGDLFAAHGGGLPRLRDAAQGRLRPAKWSDARG